MSKRAAVLVVLDGWGIGPADETNPIFVAEPKNINYIKENFPAGALQSAGISVGLPWNEEGNSEVGHLNLGAGRIIYQYYPRITLAVRDRSFFQNPALKKAFEHAKKNNSAVNIMGLIGGGVVHSSLEHLDALLTFAEKEGVSNVNLHLFTDGRDSPPMSAFDFLKNLPQEKIASISGRSLAMDRDGHWERTEKAYQAIVGDGPIIQNCEDHLKKTYENNFNDEFIEPALVGDKNRAIKDNDSVIFFNYREDRMRQTISAFIDEKFDHFPVKKFNNLYIVSMTQYDSRFKIPVAFPPEFVETPLSKILADNGKVQIRIAETQKYAHITYFFNGLKEEPFKNEYRVLIPSKRMLRLETHPEMMAKEITARVIEAIEEKAFDFILVNYANPDMIAHTGDFNATVKAIKITDEQIGKILDSCLKNNAFLIITSDHGNAERVIDPLTGLPETKHDPNPVPVYIAAKEFQRKKSATEIKETESITTGILADVTPTILALLKIPKPAEMTGQNLLKYLL
ncbi:MAG: 2,3-bisphosphoglycerate-independent phosphoglycerate mutase [Patescibacteria group bacterium]